MYRFIAISIVFISSFELIAQFDQISWVSALEGVPGYTVQETSTVDNEGNIYNAGRMHGTVDFDPSINQHLETAADYNGQGYIQKLDSIGNLVWVKILKGATEFGCSSITVDNDKNLLLTGVYEGFLDADPGNGIELLPQSVNLDVYVIKLSKNGEFIWGVGLGGAGLDSGTSIRTDSSSNVYVSGHFYGLTDFDPSPNEFFLDVDVGQHLFLLKLDEFSNFIWVKRMVGDLFSDHEIDVGISGNIYMGSFFSEYSVLEANDTLFSNGAHDICVQKIDSDGNVKWIKQIGGPFSEISRGIVVDSLDNVYHIGTFGLKVDFNPDSSEYFLMAKNNRVFVQKLDGNGVMKWSKAFGDDLQMSVSSIVLDKNQLPLIGGGFRGEINFVGTTNYSAISNGGSDGYLLSLSKKGGVTGFRSIGGPNTEAIRSVLYNQRGEVFVHGKYDGDCVIESENMSFVLPLEARFFLLKFGEEMTVVDGSSELYCYPNPTNDKVFIAAPNLASFVPLEVKVFDNLGSCVLEARDPILLESGVDLRLLNPGVYSILAVFKGFSKTFRVVKI